LNTPATAATLAVALALAPSGAAAEERPPALAGRTYLVLPFENVVEETSLDWMSTGLALSVGEYLRGFGARVVDVDERAVLLEANGIPHGAGLSLGSAIDLGRKARERPGGTPPDRLVLGRFDVRDGTLTLHGRIVDLRSGKARPWAARDGRLKDLLAVQEDLAVALLTDEGVRSPARSDSLRRQRGGLPVLAFETYCRAMAETVSKRRLQLLRRAVQEFPGYPKAALQAASLLAREERWSEAETMLERAAFVPHPYESEYHMLAAAIALERGNPERAEEEARRSLDHGGGTRARILLARALVALGDREQARVLVEETARTDPADPDLDELRRTVEGSPSQRRHP
jgi:Tfp pilus assembly protein PilF/TolB-like protein